MTPKPPAVVIATADAPSVRRAARARLAFRVAALIALTAVLAGTGWHLHAEREATLETARTQLHRLAEVAARRLVTGAPGQDAAAILAATMQDLAPPSGTTLRQRTPTGALQAQAGYAPRREGAEDALQVQLSRPNYTLEAELGIADALRTWGDSALHTVLGAVVVAVLFLGAAGIADRALATRALTLQRLVRRNRRLLARNRAQAAALSQIRSELNHFSYSVSHDLRAPLRAINGFSHALEEDYGPALDPRAHGYLQRVRAASNRMSDLIDGLVELTHLARRAPLPAVTDLSAIAADVAHRLAMSEPDRTVRFDIAEGLTCHADPGLARKLLTHLFANAWKFTRTVANARITFGAVEQDDAPVFFVDDNGVGFDMAHASKLFAPFQRLHADPQLEGSGIGLAAVKRIIELHGGTAWIDAAPRLGVTVFFTLDRAGARGPRQQEAARSDSTEHALQR